MVATDFLKQSHVLKVASKRRLCQKTPPPDTVTESKELQQALDMAPEYDADNEESMWVSDDNTELQQAAWHSLSMRIPEPQTSPDPTINGFDWETEDEGKEESRRRQDDGDALGSEADDEAELPELIDIGTAYEDESSWTRDWAGISGQKDAESETPVAEIRLSGTFIQFGVKFARIGTLTRPRGLSSKSGVSIIISFWQPCASVLTLVMA